MGATAAACAGCEVVNCSRDGSKSIFSAEQACCSMDRVMVHADGIPIQAYYSMGSEIGTGGYATVHRCRERRTGVIRAVKNTDKGSGDGAILCARMEVDILRELQRLDRGGGSVVRLFEVFEDVDAVHMVMELCNGGELYQRQSEAGVFTEAEGKILFVQMVRAVEHVHRHEVAHRDLKLENWLLTRAKPWLDLRLCDFGLSIFLRSGAMATDCVGSVYYVAPEVLNGCYNERADIWSLGVILYMLLSGMPPFNGDKQSAILRAILTRHVSFEAPVWRGVSEAARMLIVQLLCTDVEVRIHPEAILQHPWLEGALKEGLRVPGATSDDED